MLPVLIPQKGLDKGAFDVSWSFLHSFRFETGLTMHFFAALLFSRAIAPPL